jgi:sensor c-di-GMP phosphodiesterase-like protein
VLEPAWGKGSCCPNESFLLEAAYVCGAAMGTIIPFKGNLEKICFYVVLATAISIAAVGTPILVFSLTRNQLIASWKSVSSSYVRGILVRSDRISAELRKETRVLGALGTNSTDRCSDANIRLMRDVVIRQVDFAVVGYQRDNRLLCSSLGRHPDGIPIGPVTFTAQYTVRTDVRLDFSPDVLFIAVEYDGWTFLIPKYQPIDIHVQDGVSLATFSTMTRDIRTSLGHIRPEWMLAAKPGHEISFVDDGYVVSVLLSPLYPTGAIAALPLAEARPSRAVIEGLATGAAIVAGVSIAAWIVYLARQWRIVSPLTLNRAIRNDELSLVYQPVIELRTGRWVGAEVLLRWKRGGKEVPTEVFIKAAENYGLIGKLTGKLFSLVEREAAKIFAADASFFLSLNLAGTDVQSMHVVTQLQRLIKECGAEPDRFKIEITERGLLDETVAKEVVDRIRAIGIRTMIDDFGVAFSNLDYLTMFNFDYLKIDRMFIRGLGASSVAGEVAFHIIALAQSLKLGVVAEGVEDKQQAALLRDHGVEFAQGWLFSRPKSVSELVEFIRAAGPTNI